MTAPRSVLVTGGAGFIGSNLVRSVPDRPSHERRHALDWTRIRRELGWQPEVPFKQGFTETIAWYAANRTWWEPLLERAPVNEEVA